MVTRNVRLQYNAKFPVEALESRCTFGRMHGGGAGALVEYWDCDLSYRSIAARVDRDPMTVSRIWIQCVQDGNTEHLAGSQRRPITSSLEFRHVTSWP
ncbi:hypothetical protein TNCV_4592661 [Trichonephila clavipes]|nr:hypothetical protein TNCV_4592661 [Trichonephila clavipes]